MSAVAAPSFRVYADGRVPIKSWAAEVEEGALAQARNLANLPFAISHVALMPDAHQGYGMPIGGVLFADRVVVPYAIGVDIGCGVALLATGLTIEDMPPDRVQAVLDRIAELVPVGNGPRGGHATPLLDEQHALERIGDDLPEGIKTEWWDKALPQLGSLGGGNHFIEVQRADDGAVFVMLHSGSRSLGKQICDHFHKAALELNRRWFSALPDKELAYLPWETDEAHRYWQAMQFALRYAEVSRELMLEAVGVALSAIPEAEPSLVVDIHHNYAAWESHRGKNGIVHRKGAVRAREGDLVLIPGSMGTASYIGTGLGNPDSFETCQHGAGRAMSRAAAEKLWTSRESLAAAMPGVLTAGLAADARDEAPGAYKDIEAVMAASADLVRPVRRLTPLGVVKG